MSFRKINVLALVAGVICGVAFFLVISTFRESFVAAALLDSDGPGRSRGWRGLFALLGGATTGWAIAALSDRLSAESYLRLLLPLGIFVVTMTGTAVLLELEYLRPIFMIVFTPTLLLGATAAAAAILYGWIRS
jgi:hypothetical protein